jgi:polysaccharide export outer membrane protein
MSLSLRIITYLIAFSLLAPCRATAGDKTYKIGQGDILTVQIFAGGAVEETMDLTVSSKGTVVFPFLGEVKAGGLTVYQLTDRVTKPLAQDYFVNPQVIISIKEHKSKKVYITGAVKSPGLHPLEGKTTLLELIAKAGGVTKERSDYAHILRGSMDDLDDNPLQSNKKISELVQQKKSIQVDLRELLDHGAIGRDVELRSGDVVYIPPTSFVNVRKHKIYVLGDVNKPGAYDYQEGLTALDACILAGGFAKYAAPNRTTITRREANGTQKIIKINLKNVRKGKDEDVPLKPGDRLFVPESWF